MGIEWFNETVFTALFGNLSPAESDVCVGSYRGAGKSLARPGRKQARKHVRERAISTTSRRELSSSFFLQGKAPKEIHTILTETLACFLPGRAKDLSAHLTFRQERRFYCEVKLFEVLHFAVNRDGRRRDNVTRLEGWDF